MTAVFREHLRRNKSAAFDLKANSTAGHTIRFDLWGSEVEVYANANLSIYSAQTCNARCPFCVEELRPASRGMELAHQRTVEQDDGRYFEALGKTLQALRPLTPTFSITGGEPSKDARLPRILRTCAGFDSPRRTITTNGSGLLDLHEGRCLLDHVLDARLHHLNISRAHPGHDDNARLMVLRDGLTVAQLRDVVAAANGAGTRVRLSCVLVEGAVDSVTGIRRYLDFARDVGADNVIFRQLMLTDPEHHLDSPVVRYGDRRRIMLEPILDAISEAGDFDFVRQIVGYYYYVEVWRQDGVDVVFEEADLAQLQRARRLDPRIIHELVFHPNARLASTWQPWDGVLGPPRLAAEAAE